MGCSYLRTGHTLGLLSSAFQSDEWLTAAEVHSGCQKRRPTVLIVVNVLHSYVGSIPVLLE
jgi:hypothetical protein